MPIEELKSDLARLRQQIDALDGGDSESARHLQELQALALRIERELEEQQGLADPVGLVEELEAAVSRFEADHPTLGALLKNVINLLGSIGV